jgi:hypothetical protein
MKYLMIMMLLLSSTAYAFPTAEEASLIAKHKIKQLEIESDKVWKDDSLKSIKDSIKVGSCFTVIGFYQYTTQNSIDSITEKLTKLHYQVIRSKKTLTIRWCDD